MTVGRRVAAAGFAFSCLVGSPAHAQLDPAAAREHLKQGYALRKEGRCNDAIVHFVESVRLDPTAKALLNLAQCEQETGMLGEAVKHAVDARDRARSENQPELLALAEEQIAAIEKRLARLTIRLGGDHVSDVSVNRDGATLGPASIGAALPISPGKHSIVVRAPGRTDRAYEVTLAEGDERVIDVEPGPVPAAPVVHDNPTPLDPPERGSIVPYLVGGAGLVLVGVGTFFGVRASDQWAEAQSSCGTGCVAGGPAHALKADAETSATVSTATFVAGTAAVAAGVVLWFVMRDGRREPVRADARGMTVAF